MEQYTIISNDCHLHVYVRGKQSKTAIVFLHGGPGSGAKALYSLPAFQAFEEDYLCIHFDQRGSGNSPYDISEGISIRQVCSDVKHIIQDTIHRYGCEQIILWGGSYGGTLACLYMEYDGEGVDGIILNNPAITFSRDQSISFYERMKQASLQRMPKDMQVMKSSNLNPEVELQDEEFTQFVFSKYNPSNALRHIFAMSSWFFSTTFEEALIRISVPTLLMLGKEDCVCNNEDTISVVNIIQNPMIELKVLPSCGHAIFEDCEEEFVLLTKRYMHTFISK